MPQGSLRPFIWIIIPLLLISFFNRGLGFYTDWLWYQSLELESVFITRITATIGLFAAGAVIFWIFLAANVLLARRLEPKGLDDTPVSQVADALGVRITPVILLVGAVFAFFMGSGLSGAWEEVLLFLNQTQFGITDPLFNNDVSFYVFSLPIWQLARNWLMTTLVLTLIATALVSGVGWQGWNVRASVRAHLSFLGALILLLIAWQYRLDALQLVYSWRGAIFGAGYTDVNAQLPAYNILLVITLIVAALLMVNVFLRRTWRAILVVLVVWFGVSVVAGNFYPGAVQQFQVAPNEFTLERSFIEHNIRLTREAYGLSNIEEVDFRATEQVLASDILNEPETILNIRLWDYRPLLQTYNQIQALRQYYQFMDIDVDRYMIDGELRQVMLAARELVPEQLDSQAQTWVNRRLVYTHGYGVAISPVAQLTRNGLPEFYMQDLPPRGILNNTQPEIYFGERTLEYVIVRTDQLEFSYPAETGNVFTQFSGEQGISMGNFMNRLIFALRFGDINIILTDAITDESLLLWRRNIQERTQEVAPFLRYDADPYIVLGQDGKLYWIHDAYTTSSLFPYSMPLQRSNAMLPDWRLNYIRNSVKVVTDVYTGEMTFYVMDQNEPIIAAYSQIFPALFTPFEQMPDFLKEHIRYPNDLFTIQAELFRTYQMTNPAEFYNREDLWAWPEEIFDNRPRLMEPYYVLMELPGMSDGLDFVQILPFTPANRENMIAWLAAKSSPDQYGRMIIYRFGKDTLFLGPRQMESRIDQDPVIAAQLALWNQQGSQVIRGNLLVIPVGNGLLYVEPLYLQAEGGRIPELRRIILATQDQVVMAENLGLALAAIFGPELLEEEALASLTTGFGSIPVPSTIPGATLEGDDELGAATMSELIIQANSRFDRAQEAMRNGDWATYGTELQALERLLIRLAEVSGIDIESLLPNLPEDGGEIEETAGDSGA
jgi:uncharacterized membrane protein (UPF0182 family)